MDSNEIAKMFFGRIRATPKVSPSGTKSWFTMLTAKQAAWLLRTNHAESDAAGDPKSGAGHFEHNGAELHWSLYVYSNGAGCFNIKEVDKSLATLAQAHFDRLGGALDS